MRTLARCIVVSLLALGSIDGVPAVAQEAAAIRLVPRVGYQGAYAGSLLWTTRATVTGQGEGTVTITATSEGVAGHATITVQEKTVDDAASLGNTFPSSMSAGGIASVTLTMRNSGMSTWNTGYRLSLVREAAIWMPSVRFLSADVAPGTDQVFAFDLRHVEPEVTGTVAAFYRMMSDGGVLFGDENGRDIFVSGTKTQSATTEPSLTSPLESSITTTWTAGAEDGGVSQLPIPASALAGGMIALLEYTYSHAAPRDLDVVLRFTYDPDVLVPLPLRPGSGAAGLARTAGLTAAGEYWIRLTGVVPAGEGWIVTFPFRLKNGASPPETLGTLRMYYPTR